MKDKLFFKYLLKLKVAFSLIILILISSGCSEDENSPASPPSDPNAVSIQSNSFNPGSRTVSVGTTIKWTNNDNVTHTVTSGSPGNQTTLFDSGNLASGQTFEFTFTQTGTFNYFCKIHPSMTAQIIVQ